MCRKEPVEIEVKIPVSDEKGIMLHLKEKGFLPGTTETETDIYFNSVYYDLKQQDKALRIRTVEDEKSGKRQTELNCKGPKLDDVSMSRKEIETTIQDPDKIRQILEELSFFPAGCRVKKKRHYFSKGRITAAVDVVEDLGTFLELEILEEGRENRSVCLQEIEEAMKELGYSMKDTVRVSYLTMLERKKEEMVPMGKQMSIKKAKEKQTKLQEIEERLGQLKQDFAAIIDEYEDNGGEGDAIDSLTEALDALEDAYDGIWDVLEEENPER